jgi:thioredoxin-like negative regulator of GroEL
LIGKKVIQFRDLLPVLILFKSTFCSKCLQTRKQLLKSLNSHDLVEIDIAKNTALLEEIKPKEVPTIILLDRKGTIVSFKEGLISEQDARSLSDLLNKLMK